jgi:hypothetical protein
MPWNGSGVFSRVYSWVSDAAAGLDILSDRMDTDTDDLAAGLMHCLTVNGETLPVNNLPMANFRHTGASPGIAASDYATVGQVLNGGGGIVAGGFVPLAGNVSMTGPLGVGGELTGGDRYGDAAPLSEIQGLRSTLRRDIRQAQVNDPNKADALGGLDKALFSDVPDSDFAAPRPPGLDDETAARYADAIDASRQFNETYNRGPLGRIFRDDRTGAPLVPDSAVLDKVLGPGQGQPERAASFLRATNDWEGAPIPRPDGTTQIVTPQQTARDWFTSKLSEAANPGGVVDAQGNPVFSSGRMRSFLAANRPLVDSDLFTDAQRTSLDRMTAAAEAHEAVAGEGGLQAMGVPRAAPSLGGLALSMAGLGVGHHYGFDPGEVLLGAFGLGGLGAGHGFGPRLYASPRAQLTQMLANAAIDPNAALRLAARTAPPAMPSPSLRDVLARSGFAAGGAGLAGP